MIEEVKYEQKKQQALINLEYNKLHSKDKSISYSKKDELFDNIDKWVDQNYKMKLQKDIHKETNDKEFKKIQNDNVYSFNKDYIHLRDKEKNNNENQIRQQELKEISMKLNYYKDKIDAEKKSKKMEQSSYADFLRQQMKVNNDKKIKEKEIQKSFNNDLIENKSIKEYYSPNKLDKQSNNSGVN